MAYFCIMIGTTIRGFVISLLISLPYISTPVSLPNPPKSIVFQTPTLTLENVYRELLLKDVKFPEVVLRQVIWETQWLKCNNCSLEFNNLFGFTTKKGMMRFKTWVDCIKFYKQWQTKRGVEKCEDYYALLKKARFASSPGYNKQLQSLRINSITEKFEITNPN